MITNNVRLEDWKLRERGLRVARGHLLPLHGGVEEPPPPPRPCGPTDGPRWRTSEWAQREEREESQEGMTGGGAAVLFL